MGRSEKLAGRSDEVGEKAMAPVRTLRLVGGQVRVLSSRYYYYRGVVVVGRLWPWELRVSGSWPVVERQMHPHMRREAVERPSARGEDGEGGG